MKPLRPLPAVRLRTLLGGLPLNGRERNPSPALPHLPPPQAPGPPPPPGTETGTGLEPAKTGGETGSRAASEMSEDDRLWQQREEERLREEAAWRAAIFGTAIRPTMPSSSQEPLEPAPGTSGSSTGLTATSGSSTGARKKLHFQEEPDWRKREQLAVRISKMFDVPVPLVVQPKGKGKSKGKRKGITKGQLEAVLDNVWDKLLEMDSKERSEQLDLLFGLEQEEESRDRERAGEVSDVMSARRNLLSPSIPHAQAEDLANIARDPGYDPTEDDDMRRRLANLLGVKTPTKRTREPLPTPSTSEKTPKMSPAQKTPKMSKGDMDILKEIFGEIYSYW